MNRPQELAEILRQHIDEEEPRPFSNLESTLIEIKELLENMPTGLPATPPPQAATAPQLDTFCVDIVLSHEYLAESEDEAWKMALDHISGRKGMQIISHKIHKLNPPPSDFL